MTKQEFKDNMILLKKQLEMLSCDLGMEVEFSDVDRMFIPSYIECSCEISLKYKGYRTADAFNNTMTFGKYDINSVAVSLISSFFRDYVQALSLKVNK